MPPKVGASAVTTATICVRGARIQLDVEDVDVGESLEEDRLALHDRLGRKGTAVPQPEDGRAVGDHAHQVSPGRVVERRVRSPLDLLDHMRHPGRIGQGKVALRVQLFRRHDLDLARACRAMVIEYVLLARDSAISLDLSDPIDGARRAAEDLGLVHELRLRRRRGEDARRRGAEEEADLVLPPCSCVEEEPHLAVVDTAWCTRSSPSVASVVSPSSAL